MASLRKENDRGRVGWRLQFMDGKRRRSLWLGDVSKRSADTIARHVSELAKAVNSNTTADVDSLKWANELRGRLRQKLAEWGYVGPERKAETADLRLCDAYFRAYIDSRADLKWRTRNNYQQAADAFVRFVGKQRLLSDVTPADVDAWRLWLLAAGIREADSDGPAKGYAKATANKHAKRIKKLFAQAARARLIPESPAADQKIGDEANRSRDFYIDGPTATKFLKWCDTNGEHEWGLIFALARFGGLRPCEMLTLTWRDVDWAEHRLRIDSPKTGLRFCPIFPELLAALNDADAVAPEGATKLVRRDTEANLGTELVRKLEAAGIKPWPKTFVNLRASCRTDLEEQLPNQAVNAWLGHSKRVAEKHYLQITDGHWERAGRVQFGGGVIGGVTGGVIPANLRESATTLKRKIPGKTGLRGSGIPRDSLNSTPARTRTLDPLIKSQLL